MPENFKTQYIVLLLGSGLAIWGLFKLVSYLSLRKRGVKVEGVIFDLISRTEDYTVSIWPVVQYYTLHPYSIKKQTDISINAYSRFKKGDKVKVIYSKHDPEEFIIDDGNYLNAVYAFLIPGILLILTGALIPYFQK